MIRVLRLRLMLALVPAVCLSQSSGEPPKSPIQQSAPSATPAPLSAPADGANTPVVDNPIGEARASYRRGDFAAAIAKYQEILQQNPKSPDAYAGLVHVYLKQKNVEQAAEVAEKGTAQTASVRMRVARAEVWFRQGKIAEAEKEWVEVINSGYPDGRAYLGLARVRAASAMYKSARRMIEKAHELDPYDSDIQNRWVGTLSRSERIKYLQDALAGANNWDAEQQEDTRNYLAFLTERARQKRGSCRLVGKVDGTETPMVRLLTDPTHLRGYGLSVILNGHKSSLMLDTGASGILVKRSIAEHAGISKITATKIGGIGDKGRRNAFVGVADSIKVGDLEFQNCEVEVMEGCSVADEDGLIGTDVFEDFLVDLDFPNEKLKLTPLPKRPGEVEQRVALKDDEDGDDDTATDPDNASSSAKAQAPASPPPVSFSGPQDRYIAPEMQSFTHVFRFGHDLLVPTSIGKVPYKLFLMDTGSVTNFISPAAAREVTKVHGDDTMTVRGISGKVDKVYTANRAVLQFGHVRQENQDMTAFDTRAISDGAGIEVSGLLGFTLLRFLDIKIDYRDALIDFKYDPKPGTR